MEYFLIVLVLLLKAVFIVAIQFRERGAGSVYRYIQPFIFPLALVLGIIFNGSIGADIVPYIIILGLEFELITFCSRKNVNRSIG